MAAAVRGERLERVIRAADRTLDSIERDALSVIDAGLVRAARQLEEELSRLYRDARTDLETVSRGSALREARARVLLAQVRSLLSLRADGFANDLQRLSQVAYAAGNDEALTLLNLYDSALIRTTAVVPVEVISAASNAAERLAHHGQAFASKATEVIVSGMTRGQSWSRTATELRREVGITRARAEMIVRTESQTAAATAREASYQANGVEWFTWYATSDTRVCKWCSSRAGSSWEVGKGPTPPAHPSCRCSTAPDSPRYRELGLIDVEFARRHNADTMRRAGIDRRTFGPTSFEAKAGREFALPVWSP